MDDEGKCYDNDNDDDKHIALWSRNESSWLVLKQ